jgi:hypothetical protein
MHPLARRIAIHGALAAGILAVMGFVFSEVVGAHLASDPGTRPGSAQLAQPDESLRWRIPLSMAFWGVVLVAVIELVMYAVRGNPKPAAPAEPQPDAEKLLNDLLAQAEAKAAAEARPVAESDAGKDPAVQESGVRGQESESKEPEEAVQPRANK